MGVDLNESTKRQIKRGYYAIHYKRIEDKEINKLTKNDIKKYIQKTKKLDRQSKRDNILAWIIGLAFYGGIGVFVLLSFMGSDSNQSSTSEATTPSSSNSVYEEPSPSYSDESYLYETEDENCDSDYSGCVPDVSYDLDCADIGEEVEVYGDDYHGLDRDGDGYGCESY